MTLSRRGFLGLLPAFPFAARQVAQETVTGGTLNNLHGAMGGYGKRYGEPVCSGGYDERGETLKALARAARRLSGHIDYEAWEDCAPVTFDTDLSALRSVSPAAKHSIQHERNYHLAAKRQQRWCSWVLDGKPER